MDRQGIDRLKSDIEHRRRELDRLETDLADAYRDCDHQWGEVKYDPIRTAAYTIKGDPPGTMGVDRRLDCHVPAEITRQWNRTCKNCGLVQTTQRTVSGVTEGRTAGTMGTEEVPDFRSS